MSLLDRLRGGGFARLFDRSLSLRFLIIGIANTCFSTVLFLLLMRFLGMGIIWGSALALATGVLFSYYTQGSIVFRHMSIGAFLRFMIAWALIYFANLLEIKGMMTLGASRYLAGALATIPTTIVSYFIQKLIVFQVKAEPETEVR